MLTGREQYDGDGASCGREKESKARAIAEAKWSSSNGAKGVVEQLELAADEGSPRAAFLLAILILSGLEGEGEGGVVEDMFYEEGTGWRASLRRSERQSSPEGSFWGCYVV